MSTYHSTTDIADLKASIDLRSVAMDILGHPVRQAQDYDLYHAPDRSERTPSLTVWADGFKDFGDSRKGGDHFVFLHRYADLDFKAALAYLTGEPVHRAAHERSVSSRHFAQASSPNSQSASQQRWQHCTRSILKECQQLLREHPEIQAYLHHQGYTPATIAQMGIGYNPQWLKLNWKKPDGSAAWLPPGIVFPWVVDGELYTLKVRCPCQRDGEPDALAIAMQHQPQRARYMQVAGGRISSAWYGDISHAQRPTIFTEGEKDRDNLWQAVGDQVNVVTLGSATGRIPAALIEQLQDAPWIAIMLDNDEAGHRNASRLIGHLGDTLQRRMPIILCVVPDGHKDITEWLLADGDVDAWMAWNRCRAEKLSLLFHADPATIFKFPQGVPDVLREMLLGLHNLSTHSKRYLQDHASAAMMFEIIQNTVLNGSPTQAFTIASLKEAAAALAVQPSDSSLRRGVAQLEALGFISKVPPVLEPEHEIIAGGNVENNLPARGRPATTWYVVPLPQALNSLLEHLSQRLRESLYATELPDHVDASWFDGLVDGVTAEKAAAVIETASYELYKMMEDPIVELEQQYAKQVKEWQKTLDWRCLMGEFSTPLPADNCYQCGRDYRDAYYEAIISEAGPFGRQIPRAEAAAQLGVSVKTLRNIRQRTGVIAEAQFRLFPFEGRIVDVCAQANQMAPWAADREFGRYLENSNGDTIRLDQQRPADMTYWVRQQIALGYTVVLKVQVASLERFASEEELEAMAESEVQESFFIEEVPADGAESSVHSKTSVHNDSAIPEPEVVSLNRAARAYVYDQIQKRLWVLDMAIESSTAVQEVLHALSLWDDTPHRRTRR